MSPESKHEKMMNSGAGQAVCIQSSNGKQSEGQVRIETFDKAKRLKRAMIYLFGSWGLAIFSIFLPIAHFVLVPGFLGAGPMAAYFMLHQKSVVLGGEGTCPECHQVLPVVRCQENWPLSDLCSHCQTSVTIEKI